jgi:tRNA U38,U39,U40 pseudouridine synthase TruA
MVRMIVGWAVTHHLEKNVSEQFNELVTNPKKGSAITKAPGCGLFLFKVNYYMDLKKDE